MATTNDYVRDPKMSLIFATFCNVGNFPFSGPSREVAAPR